MFAMVAPLSDWPQWLRVALLSPLAFFAGAAVSGWWPGNRNSRGWRTFGITIAAFTVFCVVMMCLFHYA
jgi:hypothetical protein